MEITPVAAATIVRRDAHQNLCPDDARFWTCSKGPFTGCCSHDPCQDGYCHDLTDGKLSEGREERLQISLRRNLLETDRALEALTHMEMQDLQRRGESTTTITYTLMHITDPKTGTSHIVVINATALPGISMTGGSSAYSVPPSYSFHDSSSTCSTSAFSSTTSLSVPEESKLTFPVPVSSSASPQITPATTSSMFVESSTIVPAAAQSSTALANARILPISVAAASSAATLKPSSPASNTKANTSFGPKTTGTLSTSTTSSTSKSTTSINPTAAPVPGSKKSKATIAGLSIGLIAAALLVLLLVYFCIDRHKRSKRNGITLSISKRKKARKRAGSRVGEGIDVIKIQVEGGEALTPGGAKLEEQRGRMLNEQQHEERMTGFRALGMTAAHALDTMNYNGAMHRGVPKLQTPTPAMRAAEHPATHLGLGSLGAGLVHPAYRNNGGTKSNIDLPSITRQNAHPAVLGERFYGENIHGHNIGAVTLDEQIHQPQLGGSIKTVSPADRDTRPVSWAPGSDVIDVLMPGPLSVRPGIVAPLAAYASAKPMFNEATAQWASVSSPDSISPTRPGDDLRAGWNSIGQAVSIPQRKGVEEAKQRSQGRDSISIAMSTENEITSPVEKGGLQSPVRRNTFVGFDDLLGTNGKLKGGE